MDAHCQVGNRCRIPSKAFVDETAIHQPGHTARTPVDGVTMEVCAGVEPEIDPTGRAAIAEAHRRAIVTRIVIDVGQHSPGIGAGKLNIDLLQRSGAMQKEACNKP